MKTIKSLNFIVCLFFTLTFSYGQSIFSNEINGTNPNYPSLSDPFTDGQTIDPNITVSGIGRGPGIVPANDNNRYLAVGWNNIEFDDEKYFEFIITPNAGYEIDFVSFEFTSERSHLWLDSFGVRSSIDGFTSDIGTPVIGNNTIDLSSVAFQNISGPITFRVYAWGLGSSNGGFSINDFTFNGTVATSPCQLTVTWNGVNWNSTTSLNKTAIINADYDTADGGAEVSFSACRLIVNTGATLTIDDGDYIEIQNDIVVNTGGAIIVRPQGAVVQIDDTGTVTENGSIKVEKITAPMNVWYEYTYWSSPVSGEKIIDGLAESDARRRFWFDASEFLDATMEIENNNDTFEGQDDIDDNDNDWQYATASTIMVPGVGYASTHDELGFIIPMQTLPYQFKYTFEGPFNTGIINVPVVRNDGSALDNNWNLIGNPYPSAIDVDVFFTQNVYNIATNTSGTLEGAIYLWSQNTAPSSTANGNQNLNFDSNDYAIINLIGETQGGDDVNGDNVVDINDKPKRFIPSGQGFFVSFSQARPTSTGNVVFNNAMRVKGTTDNSQFFRTSAKKSKKNNNANKLWLDLTSDNGVFNQTLIGYVSGATNGNDGMAYDAPRNLSTGASAILYTIIEDTNKKFAIQGKAENSLNEDETISLGFKTAINVPTIYTLSIAQLKGLFLETNVVLLKDNFLNTVHDLKSSDYNFTSEIGEFNKRFEISFDPEALSLTKDVIKNNALSIIEHQNGNIQFKLSSNLAMFSIEIIDLQGRVLHSLNAEGHNEIYNLSYLSQAPYLVKVTLSDGYIITKKAIKKY